MNDALIIFKKELKNFFKDRRTLFSTFILPLLVLPIIFVGVGTVLGEMDKDAKDTTYRIAIEGNDDSRLSGLLEDRLSVEMVDADKADIVLMFPPDYIPGTRSQVTLSYDSSSQKMQYAQQQVILAVMLYGEMLGEELLARYGLVPSDLESLSVRVVDLASDAAQSGGSFLAMLVPYFLMIFLFSGSINAGLDTTSGEKERGSLAILLVNQVSRTSIAWGKILYVSVIAVCSAGATFLGFMISMILPQGSRFMFQSDISGTVVSGFSLMVIVLALFSSALFTGAVVTLLGSLAKSVKEGSTYVMPLYLVVVLVGVTTMYMDPTTNLVLFLVPIVNTIFVMKASFMGMTDVLHMVMAIVANILLAGICALLVSKLFNSEKILQTV
jgi:sodium transport system permease protein